MDSSYSIVPSDGGPLRPRRGTDLTPSPAMPVHPAGAMGIGDMRLRQECWDGMDQKVRQRLLDRAGTVIDWWAIDVKDHSGSTRTKATVFGHQALCIAEPRIDTEHRPVYTLTSYLLKPGMRRTSIDHRPPAGGTGPSGGRSAGPGNTVELGLSDRARGLLGNLPPDAQKLLQAPFTGNQPVLRCGWHYEGSADHLNMFMVYLAGAEHLTVATGTRAIPVGHGPDSAHWNLTCYRASVDRRIGT